MRTLFLFGIWPITGLLTTPSLMIRDPAPFFYPFLAAQSSTKWPNALSINRPSFPHLLNCVLRAPKPSPAYSSRPFISSPGPFLGSSPDPPPAPAILRPNSTPHLSPMRSQARLYFKPRYSPPPMRGFPSIRLTWHAPSPPSHVDQVYGWNSET